MCSDTQRSLVLTLSILVGGVPLVHASHRPKVQDCQIRFAVLMYDSYHPHDVNQYHWGQLTERQRSWWGKKGQQRFPGVCMVTTASQAEYVIAWAIRPVKYRDANLVLEPTDMPVLRRTGDCRVDANGRADCTIEPDVETIYDVRRVATQAARDLASVHVLNADTHKILRSYESVSNSSDRDGFKQAITFIATGK